VGQQLDGEEGPARGFSFFCLYFMSILYLCLNKRDMRFIDIFKDDNSWNEKTVIGFMSFAVMSIFAGADVVTGILGKELVISDTIFNSFVIITIGALGIAEAGKIFTKK
jgi:hypothetical protein